MAGIWRHGRERTVELVGGGKGYLKDWEEVEFPPTGEMGPLQT